MFKLISYNIEGRYLRYANLLLGLSQFHQKGYIHNDIKPSNLMKDNRAYLKLIDFGLANNVVTEIDEEEPLGTFEYNSPQKVLV